MAKRKSVTKQGGEKNKLAIDGGEPVRTKPFPARQLVGLEEAEQVLQVLTSQQLFYATGTKVYAFLNAFKELYGVKNAVPSTSGTAAIHVAVGTVNPEPGDEIIVTPISDMGSVSPIVLSGAIPVFADVELETFNLDPNDVADRITDRTRAIIVVHCWGRPSNLDAIMEIARERNIYVIEDCAQSHYVKYKGRLTGTIGDFGTFSFQESKHITSGDGGLTIINRDEMVARAEMYVDKGCDWSEGRKYRKQYAFFAPCYRMTELQGAVLCAQLPKLPGIIERREAIGSKLSKLLEGIKGICPPPAADKTYGHGYWLYPIRVLEEKLGASRDEFMKAMVAEGVHGGSWIGKPLYLFDSLMKQITFGKSRWPFVGTGRAEPPEYGAGLCPKAEKAVDQLFTVGLNECWADEDIEDVARAVRKVTDGLAAKAGRK